MVWLGLPTAWDGAGPGCPSISGGKTPFNPVFGHAHTYIALEGGCCVRTGGTRCVRRVTACGMAPALPELRWRRTVETV